VVLAAVKTLKAVDGVTLRLYEGETLGVVGNPAAANRPLPGDYWSGEGDRRQSRLAGKDLLGMKQEEWRDVRSDIQMIFQDPLASLNPRMTIGEIIAEPLRTYHPKMSRQEVRDRVKAMMMKVGLLPNLINRYPHEFSGGQCQRIGIARALILEPKLIICDEPVSALDVSIQAQVVNLLQQLQREMGLSLIFIAHDLAVVKHISDRVLVMYLGHAVELGTYDEVYHNPLHPYTKALMSAVPIPDPDLEKNKTIQLLEGNCRRRLTRRRGAFSVRVVPSPGQNVRKRGRCWREFPTCGFLPEGRPVIISGADAGQPFFCEVKRGCSFSRRSPAVIIYSSIKPVVPDDDLKVCAVFLRF
jgi:oligopeptide transport system ATP-binding protein